MSSSPRSFTNSQSRILNFQEKFIQSERVLSFICCSLFFKTTGLVNTFPKNFNLGINEACGEKLIIEQLSKFSWFLNLSKERCKCMHKFKACRCGKGQLISKCLFGVIVRTKKPTKFFKAFCPSL